MEQYGFSDFQQRGDYLGNMNEGSKEDEVITADARDWLRTRGVALRDEGKPWFLAVNLINPHDIMYCHPELPGDEKGNEPPGMFPTTTGPDTPRYSKTYSDPIPASYDQPIDEKGRPGAHAEYAETSATMLGAIPPEQERWEQFRDYYYNCLADVDRHIGAIIDELEELGFLENTTIIYTSDHGELQGSHGGLTNKGGFAYEYNCHVPFIICQPDGPAGVTCDAVTSHVDLAPTIVGLSSAINEEKQQITADIPGKDLASLLAKPEEAGLHAAREGALLTYQMVITLDDKFLPTMGKMKKEGASVEEIKKALRPDMDKRGFTRVVIDGRYKYTRYFAPSKHNRPETLEQILAYNDIELFDTVEDPEEMINLAENPEEHEELILEMNDKLNRLIDSEIGVDDASYLPGPEAADWFIDEFKNL
jgi:arylsulfatase